MRALLLAAALLAPAVQAADAEGYRDLLVAGDPARLAAQIAADRGRLPVDENGVTVLHRALHVYSARQVEMVAALLAAGADPNAAMDDGRTPLHFAAAFDARGSVPLLLAAGARVDARDDEGRTPLFPASPEVAAMLLAAGADPLARDAAGNRPLHRNPQPAFLVAGVDVRNDAGLTPLHFAALSGHVAAIDWLLARGADPAAETRHPTHVRAGHMSRAFGPGDEVPAGARPLDLARAAHERAKWNTSRYEPALERLEQVTPRRRWWRR